MNIDTRPFFPKDNSIVNYDNNLFLLHTHYYRDIDTLFNIYIDKTTGESRLEKREAPEVPVFIARKTPKYPQEYINRDSCERYMIPYSRKNKATRELLFEGKHVYFKDEWGNEMHKVLMPDIPYRAEYLHPGVFMLDVPIEQWAYVEKSKPMYHYNEKDKVVESDVTIPDIKYASFDIETSKDENDEWYINMNTFVDEYSKTAYIDFPVFKDGRYKRQDYLIENKEQFVRDLKQKFHEVIENLELKANEKTIKLVKDTCSEFIDTLDIKVRHFKDEATFIQATTETMFTKHKPNILMAFNTTYDIGMFQERIEKLGLPKGTFNERGIGYDNISPPFASQGNKDRFDPKRFKGDIFNPTERKVYLNNISHTMISDFQTCFYSNRRGSNYSTFNLEDTANRIIGFGKLDYSHICNNILYLPYEDFYTHAMYALIDSILLIICNKIGSEFYKKLIFVQLSKTNIEETPSPNIAVIRAYQTDAGVLSSVIPGCNINKVLLGMKMEDVVKVSKTLNIDFTKQKHTLSQNVSYGGGLVADPLLKKIASDVLDAFPVLKDEAHITTFMKFISVLYLDLKSHYPFTMYTRNLARSTLVGIINMLINKDNNQIMKYTGYVKGASYKNRVKSFGNLNVAMINRDIITYGNIANNLPSLDDLIKEFMHFDSDPIVNTSKPLEYEGEIDKPTLNAFSKVKSILTSINRLRIDKQEEKYMPKDVKHFFINDGEMVFNNSCLVRYTYRNTTFADEMLNFIPNVDKSVPLYGTITKSTLTLSDSNYRKPKNKAFEFPEDSKWYQIDEDEFFKMADAEIYPIILNLKDDIKIRTVNRSFYFPFSYWKKQIELARIGKKLPKKEPEISTPMYRYIKGEETTKIQFQYSIYHPDLIALDIDIYMQIKNI